MGGYISGWLPEGKARAYVESYAVTPLTSAAMYMILGKCLLGVEKRGWMIPVAAQFASSAGVEAFMNYTPLGAIGAPY